MPTTQTKDYYKQLGVPETATADEIKKAYRRLAKKFHPDVTGGDKVKEARFKEIGEAYETLGDEKKRAVYDEVRKNPFAAAGASGGFPGGSPFTGFGGAPFSGFGGGARRRARGGGGGAGSNVRVENVDFGDLFGGGAGGKEKASRISEMFSQIFGGAAAPEAEATPERGADVRARIEIDLPTAALGGSLPIVVDGKHLTVKVPPGIDDGQTIRIAGQGRPGPSGAGDLLLDVHVRPHERFRRHGDDLEVDVHVPVDQAVLGGKVEVPTLEKPVQVTVPAGTSSGMKLRLRGKGAHRRGAAAATGGVERGDLYAVVQISVPKDLPDRARELIEEFGRLTRK